MNDTKLQPTTTRQHKHTDETGQLNSSIHPISSWSIVFSFQKTKQNKTKAKSKSVFMIVDEAKVCVQRHILTDN